MDKVYIWGAGSTGSRLIQQIKDKEILGVLDSDKSKIGGDIGGKRIFGGIDYIKEISPNAYDEIIIGTLPGLDTVSKMLIETGIPKDKINTSYLLNSVKARENFLENFASLYNKQYDNEICVAEGGVYQGDFAKLINITFPYRTLYLFDTFSGFAQSDIIYEQKNDMITFQQFKNGHLGNTSEAVVMNKMKFKEKVCIKKGNFPDTLQGITDNKYLFVNLDFDLYMPTLAGLKYFVPRLVRNGVVLVHDFFNKGYPGVEKAVKDFQSVHENIGILPIGDCCSIALINR